MSLRLDSGEARLWYVHTEDAGDPALAEEYRRLMSAEEAASERRYMREVNQLEHRVARALVRTTLSRCTEVDPRDWVFRPGPHGRPEIAYPETPGLRFNLSHTAGLVACLVGRDRTVGVDVENTTREAEYFDLAQRYFAPAEVAQLRALPPTEQRARFFQMWTLKEAYVKARGLGLSLPLDHFAFSFANDRPAVAASIRCSAIAPSAGSSPRTCGRART